MNLVEEIKVLEEKIESYKQKIKELNNSLIDVNNIKTNDIDFNSIAHSIMNLNQRIKSAESLLNDYYKKEKR